MISWSQIEGELAEAVTGYRQAIVKVFRKYDGQETDEKDGAGRTIKVTMASFAKRFGIPKQTFHDWLGREVGPDTGRISKAPKPQLPARGTVVKRLTRTADKMHEQVIAQVANFHELEEVVELLVQLIGKLKALEAPKATPKRPTARKAVKAVKAA